MANSVPTLGDFATAITLLENTVNAPQLLDADVTFTDPDDNFDGGTLVVSGLLAEDTVSIRHQGNGGGEIGLSGATVSFGGVAIGTVAGGAGSTLTVTFNGAADSAAIEALIENLTYANSSDTPTASRTLTVEVTGAAGAGTRGTALSFAEAAPDPLDGIDTGFLSTPALGDLDGDGDLDIVVGNNDGLLFTIINTGTAEAPVFGTPAQIAGIIDFGNFSAPTLGDLDGDGDLDIVVGDRDGLLFTITNIGTAAAPVFGAAARIADIDVGSYSTPALGDLDGDGDLDIVVGEFVSVFTITNTGTAAAPVFGTPARFAFINFGLASAPALGDLDGDGDLDIVAGAQFGLLFTTTNTGTASVPDFGIPVQIAGIDLQNRSAAALGDLDGDGDLDIVVGKNSAQLRTVLGSSDAQVVVNVTAPNDAPSLTGLAPSVTLLENAVNAAPQLLDADVTFSDPDNNFSGGTLVVSGLLAEDTVSIRNEGNSAGEIGFAGGTVWFGGVAIGTVAGGAGGDFTVTFNGAANSAAIEALIENLTYANSSNMPTASRTLTVEVTDAAGAGTRGAALSFAEAALDPLDGIDVGFRSAPALGDLDGDGDLDIVVGDLNTRLFAVTNTGTAAAPVFGTPVRIASINVVSYFSALTLGDLDGDGDLDIVAGHFSGGLFTITNTGTAAAPVFGTPAQIAGLDAGDFSAPTLGDLDGDGDLDIVVGNYDGQLFTVTNTGTAVAVFGALVQIAGIDLQYRSTPALGDLDGDGDLDIVVGDKFGQLFKITNSGTPAAPAFGALVAITGISIGAYCAPALGDLDGDGDLDIVVGDNYGGLRTVLGSSDAQVTVNVTAENDAPSLTGLAPDVTFLENAAPQLLDADVSFGDPEENLGGGTLVVSGLLAEDSVSIRNQGTSAGQIGVAGGTVSFGGVAIGTVSGGAGGDLTVTFNGMANSAAIEALIENLTYANGSDTPTASRTLTVKVTDAAGMGGAAQIVVTARNHAPAGTDNSVTTGEDTAYSFTAADFGFSDALDSNGLAAVKVTTLPGAGTLRNNGVAVTAGQSIAIADIIAGKLAFRAALNANGAAYAQIGFQVQDNGGIADGGVDLDPSANTLTVNVSRVNDAPSAVVLRNVHAPFPENASTASQIKVADIAITDVDGGANNLSLSGADAGLFRLIGQTLWLKAGAVLDFETNPRLDVRVNVNDATVGGPVDAFANLAIAVTNIAETMTGTSRADRLVGRSYGETVNGLAGNDTIFGNGGNDRISGGTGADRLTGGLGRDVFVFNSIGDSAPGQSGYINSSSYGALSGHGLRDVITDFTRGQDRLDLSAIDASTRLGGNQAFTWLGQGNFHKNHPGELIYRLYNPAGTANDKTIVYGDVNGDGRADFQIELTGLKALAASDFVL